MRWCFGARLLTTPSTMDSDMMLHINWSQVKGLVEHLARKGFQPESDILAMVLFRDNEKTPTKVTVKLDALQEFLFRVDSDPKVIGVFLFDTTINKPLWSAQAAEKAEKLEAIPNSGHPSIISEFK